ncbi:MAG TPA: protein kinase [Microthrixaceae bacterium]|nr:protein kinase [Microthrixaceae bacterium]
MTADRTEGTVAAVDGDVDVRQTTHGGRRVVEKIGTGRARSKLRREAVALEQLRSSGVVELIEVRDDEDATTLVTTYVGSRTLADASMLQPSEILRALREAAKAILTLHDRGWIHGCIALEHVILGPRARVRLCSLGSATPFHDNSSLTNGPAASGRATKHSSVIDGADDLDQLIEMIRQLIEVPNGGNSFRERWEWRRMRAILSGAIETVAGDRLSNESEKAMASEIAEVAHSGASTQQRIEQLAISLENDPGKRTRQQRLSFRRRTWDIPRAKGLVLAFGSAVAAIVLLIGFASRGVDEVSGSETARSNAKASKANDRVSVPADSAGNLVVSEGRIYRIGTEGDRVVAGDWGCDGAEGALLLRPSTGEVFMFDNWAVAGHPSEATLIEVVEGAIDLVSHDGDCGPATIKFEDGTSKPISPNKP